MEKFKTPNYCHACCFSLFETCHTQSSLVYVQVVTTECSLPNIFPLSDMASVFSLYSRVGDVPCSHLYRAGVLSCSQKLPGIKFKIKLKLLCSFINTVN